MPDGLGFEAETEPRNPVTDPPIFLYPFLYQGGGNRRKWLIEHPKLYRFFTFFIFSCV